MGRLSVPWKRGTHIAFTGIDGAGKSTQAGKLALYVEEHYGKAYLAEPRNDFVSKTMHVLAGHHGKSRREYYSDHVVDFAKAFDVVQNHYTTLEPLLVAGMHVIEPRSIYCRIMMTLAMSEVRDEKTEEVLSLIPKPDMLFWLDTHPEIAFQRVRKRGIDVEVLDDLKKFSAAYRTSAKGMRWIRVRGNGTASMIFNDVRRHTDRIFRL